MSTLSAPASVSTPATRTVACAECRTPFQIPADKWPLWPQCAECARGRAEAAARQLVNDARALRTGAPPFDVLTPEERQEQIDALAPDPAPEFPRLVDLSDDGLITVAGCAADEISRRMGSVDPVYPDDATYPSCRVDRWWPHAADEIADRLGSVEPEPAQPVYAVDPDFVPSAELIDDVLSREEAPELVGDRWDCCD